MSAVLPDYIEPLALAKAAARLGGELRLAGFGRIAADHGPQDGAVRVDLDFGIDEQGVAFLRLSACASLRLVCNRCLEVLEYPVEAGILLGIVDGETLAGRLSDRYEPLIVGSEPLRLADLIEDELLLALPIVARHASDADCRGPLPATGPAPRPAAGGPFAALAALKTRAPG